MTIETIHRKIAPFAIELLLQEPFYGHLFSAMIKRPEKVGDLVLGMQEQQLALFIDEDWLDSAVPAGQRRGRIKHELLHLILRHPLLGEAHHHHVFHHIASDLVVNQYLSVEELEPDAITLEQFQPLQLEPYGDLEDYYRALLEVWGAVKRGEVQNTADWGPLISRCLSGNHPAIERHRYWSSGVFFLPAASRQVAWALATELLRRIRQRVGPAGTDGLPPPVRDALEQGAGDSRVDWRRILRLFASSSRKTRLKNTIRRPSKRYGTTPGIQVVRSARLLVAVDTSASVEKETLAAFFREIHLLWHRGNELMIVECDTSIQHRYEYRGRPPEKIHGRGGTLYDAPIQWANQHYRPDGILYFTDAQGPPPSVRSHSPVLWVITGRNGAHLPGRRVVLEV